MYTIVYTIIYTHILNDMITRYMMIYVVSNNTYLHVYGVDRSPISINIRSTPEILGKTQEHQVW